MGITFRMTDHVSREVDVLDDISRQEMSAAEAKAVQFV